MSVLSKAIQEQEARNIAQSHELRTLMELTTKALNEKEIHLDIILKALAEDIGVLEKINLNEACEPFPLKNNKLNFLLKGAKIIIEQHFEEIKKGNYDLILKGNDITSIPNYLQTAMLEILSTIRQKPVNQIPDIQPEKIYDINRSPNIQGVKANSDKLTSIREWRWCSKAESSSSKDYDELIVPSLGYYFGGSRYDTKYNEKAFKQEDCSSAIGKWLGLEADKIKKFTTQSILDITQNPDIARLLQPIGKDREPKKGDIFVFKGHCGVVVNYNDNESPVDVLSYTRTMPFFEGLLHQKYDQINNDSNNCFVTANWKSLAENKSLTPYYSLDNLLGNPENPKISDQVFYFEEKL